MLLNFPKLGSVYDGKVRRLVIAKQCSIFYRVQDDEISILNVFENRQNPKKN
jgi:plasmid stabilization system protein ParE